MKPRALVVDDDPEIIRSIGDILVSLDHEYDSADSVGAARQCIEHTEYTYFIIDLQIPVYSGHGLARIQYGETLVDEIIGQDEARKKRIIAITAHGNDRPLQSVEMMKKGIADYIPKPFEETGKTLDKAIVEMLARVDSSGSTKFEPRRPAARSNSLMPFSGGKMTFFPDRVELCGVDICSGRRSDQMRRTLNLLREKQRDGTFVSYSGRELASQLDRRGGQDSVASLIRGLRKRISEALRSGAGIECQRDDVILSGGPGYRFSEKLSVQVAEEKSRPLLQGHDAPSAGRDDSVNVPDDGTVCDVNVPVHDTVSDPVPDADGPDARRT